MEEHRHHSHHKHHRHHRKHRHKWASTKRSIIIQVLLYTLFGGLLGVSLFAAIRMANLKGVDINGVLVGLGELDDYKSIVESGMEPPYVLSDGTDEMSACFTWVLDEEYHFKMWDIFIPVRIPVTCSIDETSLRPLLEQMDAQEDAGVLNIDAVLTAASNAASYGKTISISDYFDYAGSVDDTDNGVDNVAQSDEDLNENPLTYADYKDWTVSYEGTPIIVQVPNKAITLNDDGTFEIVDYSFIDGYVESVALAYNNVGGTYPFTTHDGSVVMISGGVFGDTVDKAAEKEALTDLFEKAESQSDRTPLYSSRVEDGFDTYVEVSLSEQHVWFYEDGELLMDSDCVSGLKGTDRATPTGFWAMNMVLPGKTLYSEPSSKGTWVNRWMQFTTSHCGLHDASWRSEFGGNIYTYNGSHGCVNLPTEFAYELYEHAYIGLPVIVY